MRNIFLALVALAGCSSKNLVIGPTQLGLIVPVTTAVKIDACRQAVESVLPLYMSSSERLRQSDAVAAAVLKTPCEFIKAKNFGAHGAAEVMIDKLGEKLDAHGLLRPAGFMGHDRQLLVDFGDAAASAPNPVDIAAGTEMETALFGRGLVVKDARDTLAPLRPPITGHTTAERLAQSRSGGWTDYLTGRVEAAAAFEPKTKSWRATATVDTTLYSAESRDGQIVSGKGDGVELSSGPAVARAVESACADVALRIDHALERGHKGRAEMAILLEGYRDFNFVMRVVEDLRAVSGVTYAGAAGWNQAEGMTSLRVYSEDVNAEKLAIGLLKHDNDLHISGIETGEGRLTVEGPMVPENLDRGEF